MAWWSGKVSLGGLQDIAGAVNKISESVKNIEKNFDSALGLEEKRDDEEASGSRTSNSDRIGFFNPVMAFMGHNGEEDGAEVSEKPQSPKNLSAEEENHSTPTKKQISEVDPSEVSGTTSPKQPSKSEEAHSISNESPVSKADVSEQPMTPQTPTHPSVAEEKIDGSTEAPASKVGDAEAPETSQSPGHPSTVEENQDHQDSKHSGPSDEAEPNQLRESAEDLPDGSASSSPIKIDKSGDTETGESIHTGKEDTSDGNTSQPQPAESMLVSSDNITEAEDEIAQEYDAPKELSTPLENSDTVDIVTHLEVKLHDGDINTEKSEEESNKMEAGEASVVVLEDNVMEKPEDLTSKSITAVHDSHLQNESVVSSTDVPAGLGGAGPASDFTREEKIPESVRSTDSQILDSVVSVTELEKLRCEMKMMEAALQGAARQSQSKADEIARLMNENEQLKSTIDDLKSKSSEAEMDALKDEYHQRVATLERKVYALTKERDTLRREQNKKSDAAALLKEKDEIINQVMAEGLAAMEGRAIVRADRPDAGRVQRRGCHHAVRQGGAAVRAGQRHGPTHHDRRDGDARKQGWWCGSGVAAGPEAAAALLAQGQQQRRRVIGGKDAVARHRVVQHQRPHHHRHPRGQMTDDPTAVSTTSIVILAGWDMN